MFYRPDFLSEKRALIQEIIITHNAASLNLDQIKHISAEYTKFERLRLKDWKKAIIKFNRTPQFDPILIRHVRFLPVYADLQNFQSRIHYAYGLNTLVNAGLVYLLMITFGVSPFVFNPIATMARLCLSLEPYFPLFIGQAFTATELEHQFEGSAFDEMISDFSQYSPELIEHYPASEAARIFLAHPENQRTIDFKDAEFDKLSEDYLNQLANTLPHIEQIQIDINVINKMSFEQLNALAKITPNANLIIPYENLTSEKAIYLQKIMEETIYQKNLDVIRPLHQLKKELNYPSDIINHVATFFSRAPTIQTHLDNLERYTFGPAMM